MQSAARQILLAVALLSSVLSGEAGSVAVAPTTDVAPYDAMADAQALASLHSHAKVMQVSGSSMHPFFGDGSLIVVKPIEVHKLRAGMVVVYSNHLGEKVAHRLIERLQGGWVAQGYNNEAVDSTPVNAENLLGVVYATFHVAAADSGMKVASVGPAVETALAAPAR